LQLPPGAFLVLGMIAFCSVPRVRRVFDAKLMNMFSSQPINRLICRAGVSAVPNGR